MAVIKPFKSWQYNPNKITKWDEVIVPPYDVISPDGLKKLKNKSAYSYSHIILAEGEKRHQIAAQTFKSWQKSEVMVQQPQESLYFYRQKFYLDADSRFLQKKLIGFPADKPIERVGFFARVGLEEYSDKIVLPHEKTFAGPKKDRYELMEQMQGNAEPVFLGYPSERFSGDEFHKAILATTPTISYTDGDNVSHELWSLCDKALIKEIETVFSRLQLFILDGHHRYETALKFYKDHQKADARLSHRFVLAQVCSLDQFGAIILPTHRLVRGVRSDFKSDFFSAIKFQWQVAPFIDMKALETALLAAPGCAFGLLAKNQMFLLTKKTDANGKLDLEVLQDDMIAGVLSHYVDPELSKHQDVVGGSMHDDSQGGCELGFSKSPTESVAAVNSGEYQLAFLVRPSSVDEVVRTAQADKVMPHKSTFFFPKIPSGLVVNLFD